MIFELMQSLKKLMLLFRKGDVPLQQISACLLTNKGWYCACLIFFRSTS
ncbi:hypothetical protein GLYMA_10G132000v4 [Glycine max]|uniref:Uncharacterized protein n=1 Tax=Glycine max TaxID=3847 RepID=A0A0R0HSK1_SOYBN|nr:hypothetical protein GYH30_027870 [Glycine max]KRH33566.1 hypothetical protein GLYMA_10G132000v4 [Glycine max]